MEERRRSALKGPDYARGKGSAKAKEEGRLRYRDLVPEIEENYSVENQIGGKASQPEWIQEILDQAAKQPSSGEGKGDRHREECAGCLPRSD